MMKSPHKLKQKHFRKPAEAQKAQSVMLMSFVSADDNSDANESTKNTSHINFYC